MVGVCKECDSKGDRDEGAERVISGPFEALGKHNEW